MTDTRSPLQREPATFNPKAAMFNPGAPVFQPTQLRTSAGADQNAGSLFHGPVTLAGKSPHPGDHSTPTLEVATDQHSYASLSTTTSPSVVIPHAQTTPLRHLIPRSIAPLQPWVNDLENHAVNLGLPMAPSQNNIASQGIHNGDDSSVCQSFDSVIAPPQVQQSAGATLSTPEGKPPGILFPPDTRAYGLDFNLVQHALTKTLTAEDLAKHLESSNPFAMMNNLTSTQGSRLPSDGLQARTVDDQEALHHPPGLTMPHNAQVNRHFHNLQDLIHNDQQPSTPPSGRRTKQEAFGAVVSPQDNCDSPMDSYSSYLGSPQAIPGQHVHHAPPPVYNQPHTGGKFLPKGHRPSGRGRMFTRPQFVAKPKRADQGPEPSSADIYPEDHPVSPEHRRGSRMPYPTHKLPENLHVEDETAWPTPAEAVTNKVAPGRSSFSSSTLRQPSVSVGVNGQPADEAHSIQSVSAPEISTFITPPNMSPVKSSLSDRSNKLMQDTRSMTPRQIDGSRYGLRFFGIGYKDEWLPPAIRGWSPNAGPDVPWPKTDFRTRPRLHEGWGGWEWAHRQGWCNDDE